MSSIFCSKTSREENFLQTEQQQRVIKIVKRINLISEEMAAKITREKNMINAIFFSQLCTDYKTSTSIYGSLLQNLVYDVFLHTSRCVCAGISGFLFLPLSISSIPKPPALPQHTFALSQALAHITPLSDSFASTDECNKTTFYLHLECLFSHSCCFIPSLFPILFFCVFYVSSFILFQFLLCIFICCDPNERTNDIQCMLLHESGKEERRQRENGKDIRFGIIMWCQHEEDATEWIYVAGIRKFIQVETNKNMKKKKNETKRWCDGSETFKK